MKKVRVKKIPAGDKGSVCIIGGADGPTAIYLKDGNIVKKAAAAFALALLGITALIVFLLPRLMECKKK